MKSKRRIFPWGFARFYVIELKDYLFRARTRIKDEFWLRQKTNRFVIASVLLEVLAGEGSEFDRGYAACFALKGCRQGFFSSDDSGGV
jgi:hypothetical protein